MTESFKMAIKSIWSNKMRSFLTMLGIIIGVAAVIILVSVVNGYMSTMIESFTSMGVDRINVSVNNMSSRSLDPDDMYEFFDEHYELFENMTPSVNVSMPLKNGSETMSSTSIGGYSEDYIDIVDYDIAYGRSISYADCEAERNVAVLGYYTALELFDNANEAVGEKIKIGNNAFTVIGVIERQDEDELEEGGTDDFIWLPYSAATKMNFSRNVSSYIITSRDTDDTEECTEAIESFLYDIFKSDDFYNVTANSSLLDEMNEQIGMLSMMLGGIAGISLLVAGVGVMNIMLVSVTERTKEIGIRKALGAKKGVIMQQFVIEAAVTSSIGGVIGIIVGALGTSAVGGAIGINAVPTLGAVAVSFSVSVGIGLLFGYMPASRAALLNPIDALRTD
ncbi:MAG TPA: ABC transporter permease [Candidatus Avilachnospira avistercoris]|nr:ABC transporter permease [Candidatus Avilachnospira avistercoris]